MQARRALKSKVSSLIPESRRCLKSQQQALQHHGNCRFGVIWALSTRKRERESVCVIWAAFLNYATSGSLQFGASHQVLRPPPTAPETPFSQALPNGSSSRVRSPAAATSEPSYMVLLFTGSCVKIHPESSSLEGTIRFAGPASDQKLARWSNFLSSQILHDWKPRILKSNAHSFTAISSRSVG